VFSRRIHPMFLVHHTAKLLAAINVIISRHY
jgi:hypothetical protein